MDGGVDSWWIDSHPVDSPFAPALGTDCFVVRWEGFFRVPATGTYRFAGVHAAGAKIWVDNNQVYNATGQAT